MPTHWGTSVADGAYEMKARRWSALLFISCALFVIAVFGGAGAAHASAYPPTLPCAQGCPSVSGTAQPSTGPVPPSSGVVLPSGGPAQPSAAQTPHGPRPSGHHGRAPGAHHGNSPGSGSGTAPAAPKPPGNLGNDAQQPFGDSTPPLWLVAVLAGILIIVGSAGVAVITRRR